MNNRQLLLAISVILSVVLIRNTTEATFRKGWGGGKGSKWGGSRWGGDDDNSDNMWGSGGMNGGSNNGCNSGSFVKRGLFGRMKGFWGRRNDNPCDTGFNIVSNPGPIQTKQPVDERALSSDLMVRIESCTDDARLWIRAAFHDAGTWDMVMRTGGADGSLQFELDRSENKGLERAISFYQPLVTKHQVSMADMIAYAGSLAFEKCTGKRISFKFGRTSALVANAGGLLPQLDVSAQDIFDMFNSRLGFTEEETVALIGGAHSTARVHAQLTRDVPSGDMDDTPDVCDSNYFKRLKNRPEAVIVPADRNMGQSDMYKKHVSKFSNNQAAMISTYRAAFTKLIELGMAGNNS